MAFQRNKPAAIGIKANYRGFIEPALASSIDRVPSGELRVHEIKFDAYRVQVHLRGAAVKVFTRRDGREMYKHACKTGLEGVVSKVRDIWYSSGRGETLTIAGFAMDGRKWDGLSHRQITVPRGPAGAGPSAHAFGCG